MEFEFDALKSRSNKAKHGIDFSEAQAIWGDPNRLEIPAKTTDEKRWLVIAEIRHKRWTVIFTIRGQKIRIISARRSREEEVKLYEG
jgi:uncharacterized DUF497 family protein